MHLVLITRRALAPTNAVFRAACLARGLGYAEVIPSEARQSGLSALSGPRLIYRASVDTASCLVEKMLAPGAAAMLHDPHFICDHQGILLRQRGLPMAKAVFAPADTEAGLEAQVAWLGGFPVVVKRPGQEGGRGVSLARTLSCLVHQLNAATDGATLETYIAHARSWRVTVLGDDAIAISASAPAPGDFRTNAPGSTVLNATDIPPEAAALAVQAVAALRIQFGGVDLMERPDGTLCLAEVNFPCFFADQQDQTGVDIAGLIVEYLAARAV